MSNYDMSEIEAVATVYDTLRFVKDPEKDATLEGLDVLQEDKIKVLKLERGKYLVHVTFVPTVPHCSLATLIGLCIRVKLSRCLPFPYKIKIEVAEGTHDTADEVNKQINDKERVAAALENPNLKAIVEKCISDEE
ncbi:MIP18 family-like [Trinorchestia longiramus]|nr:MIP18 family-like [Trinorchestia longiramus]